MTTTDLWISNFSNGRSMRHHGGLFGPASDVAYVLMDYVRAGRAAAHPDHCDVVDFETTVSGELLLEMLRETEARSGKPLAEADGSPTISCVNAAHDYEVRFIEF